MKKLLNTRLKEESASLSVLRKHESRIFHVYLDEFTIISSGHDDNIFMWDFFTDTPRVLPKKQLCEKFEIEPNSALNPGAYDSGVENVVS